MAYLTYKDFVQFHFLPGYHMFAVLTESKLQILSYKKNSASSTLMFFTHYAIDLWKVDNILELGVAKANSKVTSFGMSLFDQHLGIVSSDAGIYCIIPINMAKLNLWTDGKALPTIR